MLDLLRKSIAGRAQANRRRLDWQQGEVSSGQVAATRLDRWLRRSSPQCTVSRKRPTHTDSRPPV
jgi:hypothetical protein